MFGLQKVILNNPEGAKTLLTQNPQLGQALLGIQVSVSRLWCLILFTFHIITSEDVDFPILADKRNKFLLSPGTVPMVRPCKQWKGKLCALF